jgi:hypothetical protein
MAFESWTALKQKMMDDLASGNWAKVSSYSVSTGSGSRTMTYRSIEDFMKLFHEVEARAAEEGGFYGQVVAVPGGRV